MEHRTLGNSGLRVAPIGLGCMGMSFAYGGADEAASLRVLHRAVELGVTLIDTAEVYGPYANEDLLGRALKALRGKVSVATKFGFKILPHGQGVERMAGVDSRPEHIVQAVEGSLSRLGIECIDLLYQHRVDPAVPIEDVVGAMAELVRAGKVRHLGLSEVSAATVRRAHAVHPIAAVHVVVDGLAQALAQHVVVHAGWHGRGVGEADVVLGEVHLGQRDEFDAIRRRVQAHG